MNPQIEKVRSLPGTFLFDLDRSARGMRLNRFLCGLARPENRSLFKSDPEAAFTHAGLSADERAMVRALDWKAMASYGANFFALEKLGRVSAVGNPAMCAQMRGEPLEDFLKTRRVPDAR